MAQWSNGGHRVDVLQWIFVGVGVFDLAFFSYYLFVFAIEEQNMISDTLFERGEYATILTVTLAARLLGGLLFMLGYMSEKPWWTAMGLAGECLTLLGWGWLVVHQDMGNHFAGVGAFCLGSLLYSMVFIRLGAMSHKHLRLLHQWLMVFLLVATTALVVSFVAVWAIEERDGQHARDSNGYIAPSRKAYIVEHAAYVAHLLFYLGFFVFHSPNPNIPTYINSNYDDEATLMHTMHDDRVSVCHPLIPMHRLSPIMEMP